MKFTAKCKCHVLKAWAEITRASIRVAYIFIFHGFYLFYSKSFKKVTIVSLKHFATVLRTSGEGLLVLNVCLICSALLIVKVFLLLLDFFSFFYVFLPFW